MDNLFTGNEAREKLMAGVLKASQAVAVTMGTSGSNSLIQCLERPHHYTTNDGATILGNIKFADPLEEMGRQVLYEAVSRANKSSGDGSSTTAVLTSAILEEGMKHIGETSPMEIKRSLEACIPLIEKSLNKQKREITTDTVGQVATISAEDEKIGSLIQEIYQKIGKEGIIQWDISKTAEDYYEIGSGLSIFGATYASPYMCDVDNSGAFLNSVKMKNALILLCKQKLTSAHDLNQLLGTLNNQGMKEIVIFVDDVEFPAIADLVKTRIEKGFRAVVVKMPILWKDEWWEDLSLASGATIIDSLGIKLREAEQKHLGVLGNITITRENVYIDGIKDLSTHIQALQAEGSDGSLIRASRLNLKTARYFVGGHSESAIAYRRLKVEDAINAASCALEHGVVAGGGSALMQASYSLPKDNVGTKILKESLKSPMLQIIKNCGIIWLDANKKKLAKNAGFDSRARKGVDMFEAGIIDPLDVVLNAVKSAIGVASGILTIGSVVTLSKEEKPL